MGKLNETNIREWISQVVNETLEEMPIANYKTIGNFDKRSSISSPVDRALVTHPRAIEKIHRQWQKTTHEFDIYVVNDPRVNKPEFREVGLVDEPFVRERMKLTPEEITFVPGHISIIFTNNVAAEKVPLTGWTMAHRLGHALTRGNNPVSAEWREFTQHLREVVDTILSDVYGVNTKENGYDYQGNAQKDKILKYVAQQLGTMRSARNGAIRSWPEFAYEILAQYLITGSIKFNRLPDSIVKGIGGWQHKQTAYRQSPEMQATYNTHDLDYYSQEMHGMIDNVLDHAVGMIFVM